MCCDHSRSSSSSVLTSPRRTSNTTALSLSLSFFPPFFSLCAARHRVLLPADRKPNILDTPSSYSNNVKCCGQEKAEREDRGSVETGIIRGRDRESHHTLDASLLGINIRVSKYLRANLHVKFFDEERNSENGLAISTME
eukprot:scaffold181254_cov32-Tisochrysis_lutea.AAC.1